MGNNQRAEELKITRYIGDKIEELLDFVAVEEPLQITVDGSPIAVVMRTVADDEDLVIGFLISEGIVKSIEDITRIDLGQKKNHALVFLQDDVVLDMGSLQRNIYSASSCGICGKASIDEIFLKAPNLEDGMLVSKHTVMQAPDRLRNAQQTFDTTGGLHAAGLFSADGELLILREDVGRHNAIDKVIGSALKSDEIFDLSQCFLQVSGRVSFEVVQKALMAGIPMVAAISAPTSLAVTFAMESGMTLIGFIRGKKMNVYSGGQRIS